MKHLLSLSFLLLIALTMISCKQKVEIKVITKNLELGSVIEDFTLANYGFVPYGQTIYSRVRLANPINGCSAIESSEDDLYA